MIIDTSKICKATVSLIISHLILSCSFRSSICLTSSRFSDERVHQLQMSMRHASRSPPTKRGGHLPPPTLIPSIPITRFPSFPSFASCSQWNIRMTLSPGLRRADMQMRWCTCIVLRSMKTRADNVTNPTPSPRTLGKRQEDVVLGTTSRRRSFRGSFAR